MDEPERYEPQPRWGHVSVTIGDKLYMWGGRIENFSGSSKKELASCVEVFDFTTEKWENKRTTGVPPSGLYNNAYTTIGRSLYVYGGWDGQIAHNTLHELNVDTLHWTLITPSQSQQPSKAPLKLSGCGLVANGLKKLVLFGGYGLVTEEKKKRKKKKKKKKKSLTVGFSQSISEEDEANVTIASESSDKPNDSVTGVYGDGVTGVSGDGVTGVYGDGVKGGDSTGNSQATQSDGVAVSESTDHNEVSAVSKAGDKSDASEAGDKSDGGAISEAGDKSDGSAMTEADEKSETGVTSEAGDKIEDGEPSDKSEAVSNGGEAVNGTANGEADTTQNDPQTKIPNSSSILNAIMDVMKTSQEEEGAVGLGTVGERPSVSSEGSKSTGMNGIGENSGMVNGHTASGGDDGSVASGAMDGGSDKAAKADDDNVFTEEVVVEKVVTQVEKWTNEVKVFDIETGEWSVPEVSGDQPPPCVDFSFLSIDDHRAVVFGGFQPDKGAVSETYVIDMASWRWTKLGRNGNGRSWPKGRDGHASCVLCTGTHPQVLISGGWDANNVLISDAWVLDVNARRWKEVPLPGVIGTRLWHTVVSFSVSAKIKQLLFFGGCPGLPLDLSTLESWSKLAATVVTELGTVDPGTHSGELRLDDPPFKDSGRSEWVVFDALNFEQLGQPARRMRERVILAEYRAIRAEKIARQVLKKVESSSFRRSASPFGISLASPTGLLSPTNATLSVGGGETNLPFWVIPRSEVRITGREIGKGRWTTVHVANYRGDHVAARCLYSQIISEENQKLFMECMNQAATLRHSNLLPFIGAILEEEPIIITELMSFNLKTIMDKGPLLNHQIIGIALDVAKALNFLHQTKPEPVSHGELTNTSVLLEQAKGSRWRAKLYDYMTAKFFKQIISPSTDSDREQSPGVFSISSLRSSDKSPSVDSEALIPGSRAKVLGRKPSIVVQDSDPFILTPSKDVYFYGLLLTEMCTGSLPLEVSLTFLIESITWSEVANIIKACIVPVPDQRPSMEEIASKVTEIHSKVSLSGAPLSRSGARPT